MPDTPAISVIMPVMNAETYLQEAIDSILQQSFGNFELLVVDDGSSDSTLALLKKCKQQDPRIRLFTRQANVGVTKNLNFLLEQSRGEYIARMDADDVSHLQRFALQKQYLDANPQVALVWSGCEIIYESEGKVCDMYMPSLNVVTKGIQERKHNYVVHPSVMYRRTAVVEKLGGYDEAYRSGQDGDLWFRMLEQGMQLKRLDRILLSFRLSGSSVTAKRTSRSADKNIVKAKFCLNNRRYRQSLTYIRQVNSLFERFKLYIRCMVGEELVDIIAARISNADYDHVHKFAQRPAESEVLEII